MNGVPPPPPPPPPAGRERFQAGRFVFGAFVALFGVAWLIEATDVWSVRWDVVLPISLIVVGVALVVASRFGAGQGGLVALGVVLTLVLAAGTVVDIPFEGGVGERVERPTVFQDRSYELAVGKLTVDLRDLRVSPDAVRVEARVGIGQLLVIVPQPSEVPCVSVHAKAGLGEVDVFGEQRGGIGPEYRTSAVCSGLPFIDLELSVGMGDVQVRRG
jgi:hypothetical protein